MEELPPFGSPNRPYFTPGNLKFMIQKYKCIAVKGKATIAYDKPSFKKLKGIIYKIRYDNYTYYVFTTNLEPTSN